MQIKEIQTTEEISQTHGLISDLSHEVFKDGYKMAAVFNKNTCLGLVGIRINTKLKHEKTLEIEDFIIDEKTSNPEIAKMLMEWIKLQSKGCKNIYGSFATKELELHKIFSHEGFVLEGFSFRKTL